MSRRYKSEHFINLEQAIRLFAEAEQFEFKGTLPRNAELRMFAKGMYDEDNIWTLGLVCKAVYHCLAQEYIRVASQPETNQEK